MTQRLLAAIQAALDALAAGDVWLATDILLAAAEEGIVNSAVPQRPPVETPIGDGKYAYQTITNAAELKKAIAAMRAVQKRAAKKARS